MASELGFVSKHGLYRLGSIMAFLWLCLLFTISQGEKKKLKAVMYGRKKKITASCSCIDLVYNSISLVVLWLLKTRRNTKINVHIKNWTLSSMWELDAATTPAKYHHQNLSPFIFSSTHNFACFSIFSKISFIYICSNWFVQKPTFFISFLTHEKH